MDTINKLWAIFDRKDKKKFLGLFILMIFAALFETLGVGLIVPFVGIITNPDTIFENRLLFSVYRLLHIPSTQSFLIVLTSSLLLIFILKNIYLLWFQHIQYKVIYNQQVKMSKRLLTAYLTMPYIFHLQKNSAQLVRNTNIEVQKVFFIISSGALALTEILVIFCILILLLVISPVATIFSAILLSITVGLFFKLFKNKISIAAKQRQLAQGNMIKWVNQGLGAGKEVKVLGREDFFVNQYTKESQKYADAARINALIIQIPRFYIETVVIATLLTFILVIMIQSQDLSQLLSTTALFAMAAFRLMPSINRIVGAVTGIKVNKPGLDVVYNDLIIEKVEGKVSTNGIDNKKILNETNEKTFTNLIELERITFKYPEAHNDAIYDVSLEIPIGKSVAFIGESGSGKTTLVDIILGVLKPYRGSIKVDGKALNEIKHLWQQKIGYIPQFIYLSDDTIRNNVALGLEGEEIDDKEVWRALEQAQLKDFVESLPGQLDTNVGEKGVKLSGGQRQRIGIARALYHNPEILFMDEATSALDNDTEKEIMKAIESLKGQKTLIIIAHRLSTIENCDIVFKMNKGKLVEVNNKIMQSVM